MKNNRQVVDMRYLREKAELRTVDVASLVGVGESTVRNWEKGRTEPNLSLTQVVKLCEIYNCSLKDLFQAYKQTLEKEQAAKNSANKRSESQ